MKKIVIISIVSILSFVIIYNYWDTETDLGNDYYFIPEYEATDIGSPFGAIVYKSKIKNSYSVEDIKISAKVLQAESRGSYIIGIQELEKDSLRRYFIIEKRSDKIFKNLNKEEFEILCSKLGIKEF